MEDSNKKVVYSHYRQSSLGVALQKVLDDLIDEGVITQDLAVSALQQFDVQMNKHLDQQKTVDPMTALIAGDIKNYRNAENSWNWKLTSSPGNYCSIRFDVNEAAIKQQGGGLNLGSLNIVATDAFPGRVSSRGAKKATKKAVAKKIKSEKAAEPKAKKVKTASAPKTESLIKKEGIKKKKKERDDSD